MRITPRAVESRRARIAVAVSAGATIAVTATVLAIPGTARDTFVAGQRGIAAVSLADADARVATDRAVRVARALGLPDGARRSAVRLADRFEGGTVDEVTTFDIAGRPIAIERFGADGSLRTAVRLGWSDATGALLPERAEALATRLLAAADLRVEGIAETRRDASGNGWSVTWRRSVDGVPVRGDGTWVRLWADGSLHSLARVETPLAEAPSVRLEASDALRIARRQLDGWKMTEASIARPVLVWIGPNDLFEPTRPDAIDGPRRLAWTVRATPMADTADIRAIELYIDAGNGSILGGDVLE